MHHLPTKKMLIPARLMARILHKFRLIFLLFVLQISTAQASGNITIGSWQENIILNNSGKISEVLARGKIKNLPSNQQINAFAINFDAKRKIKISDVICDGKQAAYSFSGNSLKITFANGKLNGDNFSIYFAFDEQYEHVDKFLRQEFIQIPSFAAGAESKVILNFPGYLESATLNPNVSKQQNSFIYSNIVPSEGVNEIIKLTPAQNTWNVSIKTKISAAKGLNNASVIVPNYFQNGGQKVENINITSSTKPTKQSNDGKNNILKFTTPNRLVLVESKALISTGQNFRNLFNRNPNDYLKVGDHELALLEPIVEKIKRNPKYGDVPLYAKIGQYVHNFIRYDESYIGKLPSFKEIMINPVGVCTEYAMLYNLMARIAKIPAINVDGAACGEYDKCVGHAWNIIFYNGKWIAVDPTWDLMSGIVSSSHVYFNDSGKGGVSVEYFDDKDSVGSQMEFEMNEKVK